jgi:WD40 repeat protein/tRNA A-37 threonylcarbamoyl transferase component Bud32
MQAEPALAETLAAVLAVELGLASAEQVVEIVAGSEPGAPPLPERLERLGLIDRAGRVLLDHRVQKALVRERLTQDIDATFPPEAGFAPAGPPPAAVASDDLGEDIPIDREERYRVLRVQGRGGQGRVLLALDERIGREVAVKELVLDDHRPGTGGSAATSVGVTRFLREARVTGLLEHPNIVPVHELGRRADGTLYYTMRFVHGSTLAHKLAVARGLQERLRLLGRFWDVCDALAFAHSRGVVHRDVKPENVMLGEFGETVLIDWGIAKVAGRADPRASELEREVRELQALVDTGQTLDGVAVGTPGAMSPEQALGEVQAIDERSDVWALGVMLYEILTGQKPFVGKSPRETLERVVSAPLVPVRALCREAPPELAAVAERALSKDKSERYQSAREVAEEIDAFMTGGRVRAHAYTSWELFRRFAARNKALLAAAGAVLAVILAALVVVGLAWRDETLARAAEHRQRLMADLHLAQAFVQQARRLVEEKRLLSARVLAAAALRDNPASLGGRHHAPDFGREEPISLRLLMEARSVVFRTEHRLVTGLAGAFGLAESALSVAFSPDGRWLAVGDYAGEVRLIDPARRLEAVRFQAHAERIHALAFSPDGRGLWTAGRDGRVKAWALEDGQPPREPATVLVAGGELLVLAISPDGRSLAAGEASGHVATWELPDGGLRWRRPVHATQVWGLAFSPDGRRLASGGWDKAVRILEAADGRVARSLSGHTDAVQRVAFSPDGRLLASASYDKSVRLWDADTGAPRGSLEGHRDAVYQAAFSPDGRLVATAAMDGTARLWDASSLKNLITLEASRDTVSSVAFSPDGRLLATAGFDRAVRLWRLRATDGLVRLVHPDWVYGIAFSRDGRRVFTGCWDRQVRVWELPEGRQVRQLAGHTDGIYSLALSPDERWVATGSFDHSARLWAADTGREVATLAGHADAIYQVAFSPDGRLLATASKDRTVRLWEVPSGRPAGVLEGHREWIYGVAFSPDGAWLASASADGQAWLWSLAEQRPVHKLEEHSDWVSGVDFSPDGKLLLTCGKDGSALLHELASRRVLVRLMGHRQWVNRAVFSPDGRYAATASDDARVILWRAADGRPLLELHASASVAQARFSPDGRLLAVTDHDQLVLYPIDAPEAEFAPEALLGEAEALAGQRLEGFELELGAP